jgi:hypothetical protein
MRHSPFILLALFIPVIFFACNADAVPLNLELYSTEYISDLVFYQDGTYTTGNVTGILHISNPSLNHTVSDININFNEDISLSSEHIDNLEPNSSISIPYSTLSSNIAIPLSVREDFTPTKITQGIEQEVVFTVTMNNSGNENISIINFEKDFSNELEYRTIQSSIGNSSFLNNTCIWSAFELSPDSEETLIITFSTQANSDININPSNLSFISPVYAVASNLSVSAITDTTFTVEKENIYDDNWRVGVVVEDSSDFDYSLYQVEVYVSDTMFNSTTLIKEYNLNTTLHPGESWSNWIFYEYEGTPVFFARIFYTIPYSISGTSMPLTASQSGGFIISSTVQPLIESESSIGGMAEPIQPDIPAENISQNITEHLYYNITQIERDEALFQANPILNEQNEKTSFIDVKKVQSFTYMTFIAGAILFVLGKRKF